MVADFGDQSRPKRAQVPAYYFEADWPSSDVLDDICRPVCNRGNHSLQICSACLTPCVLHLSWAFFLTGEAVTDVSITTASRSSAVEPLSVTHQTQALRSLRLGVTIVHGPLFPSLILFVRCPKSGTVLLL